MKIKYTFLSSFILFTFSFSQAIAQNCDFECTLKTHLDAIQNRNFEEFKETVTESKSISFILPNGKYFDDRNQFLEMIKGWFKEEGWHFNYEVVRTIKGSDMASALILVSYDEDDRNGKPYHIDHYLNLIFKIENGKWVLVHDQNTKTVLE